MRTCFCFGLLVLLTSAAFAEDRLGLWNGVQQAAHVLTEKVTGQSSLPPPPPPPPLPRTREVLPPQPASAPFSQSTSTAQPACTSAVGEACTDCPKPRFWHWCQLCCEEECCAARTLPQHHPYDAPEMHYYYRPYRYGEVIQQLGTAQPWTNNTTNSYDNRFLQVIYNDIPEVVPPPIPRR